jgi:hypothetical protein
MSYIRRHWKILLFIVSILGITIGLWVFMLRPAQKSLTGDSQGKDLSNAKVRDVEIGIPDPEKADPLTYTPLQDDATNATQSRLNPNTPSSVDIPKTEIQTLPIQPERK